jgi:hypothetical protein
VKKFLFAVALGLLATLPASADEPKPIATPVPAPTVIGTTTPSSAIYSSDSSTTRRGLLARLRGRTTRGTAMTTTVPTTTGTVITTPGTGTSVPTPMPPVSTPKPNGTTTGTPAVAGNPVVVASGTTTDGMMATTATMSSSSRMSTGRTGLLARLRARRAN